MGISDVQAVDVEHCKGSKAVSFTFPNGFKFSYSGDCRPSKAFAAIGKGSTVLLHEATFDDELQGDAQAKKHSTTSEALAVGVAMGARRVLLTHFSQRYQKIPEMDAVEGQDLEIDAAEEVDVARLPPTYSEDNDSAMPDVKASDPNHTATTGTSVAKIKKPTSTDIKVGVAFDFMRVKVGEIIHLERFTPALIKLYEPQEVEEEPREAKGETQDNKQKAKKPKRETKTGQIETKMDKQTDTHIAEHGRGGPHDKEEGTAIA
jgi:ribonuclease Z